MWVVARHRRSTWTIACAALAAVLTTTTMLRDAGGVVALAVLVGVVVAAAGTTRARTLLSVPLSVMAWPLSALRGLPLLGRTITATSRVSKLWPILRTVGLSLVALALFGGLFASGDALFGSWAEALVPDLGWDTIVARTFVLVLVAGVALTGAYLALNPPPVADVTLPEQPPRRPPVGVGRAGGHRRRPVRRVPRRPGHGDVGRPRVPRAHDRPDLRRVRAPGLRPAHRRHVPHRGRRRPDHARRRPRDHGATGCCCDCSLGALCLLTLAVVASALLPDVALPGRLRLHRAARVRRRLRAVARPGRRVPPRRRRAAVGLVGAARGARLGRRLRARASRR